MNYGWCDKIETIIAGVVIVAIILLIGAPIILIALFAAWKFWTWAIPGWVNMIIDLAKALWENV